MKATFKQQSDTVWIIDGARVSFPNLWEPGFYEGKKSTNLATSFMIAKEQVKLVKALRLGYLKLANAENPKVKKLSQLKDCKFILSDDKDLIIKTTNQIDYPAAYFNHKGKREANPLAVNADKACYAGAYVKIKLSLNAVTDAGKTKVWVQLSAIQFSEDGDRFGGDSMSDDELNEGFGEVEGDFEDDIPFDADDATGLDDDSDDAELGLDDDDFDDDELEL